MNAISGPSPSSALAALWTNAPVRPVARVTSNAQRAESAQGVDRWEPSGQSPQLPSVTYGANGRGGT